MKPLIKIMGLLALVFAAIFLALNASGVVGIDRIESWLLAAQAANPAYVGAIVALLLFADLLIAVPTLATVMLAGYVIGAAPAAFSAIIGLLATGTVGYWVSRRYGPAFLVYVVKQADEREAAAAAFQRHGPVVILLSRALPMLPEVSACMAGLTRMPFAKFITLWLINIVPYCTLAAYAGSVSTLDNPTPAIFTAIGLSVFFWSAWAVFTRWQKRRAPKRTD